MLSTRLAVMTCGPSATLKTIYDIDLSEPRSPTNQQFAAMYDKIEELIEKEIDKRKVDE